MGVKRAGARHVDGDETVDAPCRSRADRRRVAADLLGHREHREVMAGRLGHDRARIFGDGIEIKHVAIGRQQPFLMQSHRGLDERTVAAHQRLKEHR